MSIRRIATRVLTAASLTVFIAFAPLATAHAAPGTAQVEGLLVPDQSGVCHASLGTYVVSGSLEGCWYTDTFVVEHESHAGGFLASGTETFVGCLGARCGRLFTTFTFTAKYVGDIEVHGRCHHPIVGGDGDFAHASGVINMHDLPNGCATYKGHLTA
jgi:hypothetical protein